MAYSRGRRGVDGGNVVTRRRRIPVRRRFDATREEELARVCESAGSLAIAIRKRKTA